MQDQSFLVIKSKVPNTAITPYQYICGPPYTVKLEAGRNTTIKTGIRFVKPEHGISALITVTDDYNNKLALSNNLFDEYCDNEFVITITNITNEFIRLDPDYHKVFVIDIHTEPLKPESTEPVEAEPVEAETVETEPVESVANITTTILNIKKIAKAKKRARKRVSI